MLSSQYIFSPGDVKGCACSNWACLIQSFVVENKTVICKHPVQNCMSTIWFRQEPLLSYCCTERLQTVLVTSPHKVTVFSALHQGTTVVGMGGDTKSVFFLPCIKEWLLLAWWAKQGFFLPCINEWLLLAWWVTQSHCLFLPCTKECLLLEWWLTQSHCLFLLCIKEWLLLAWWLTQSHCLASRSDYCWHGGWHKVTIFFCFAWTTMKEWLWLLAWWVCVCLLGGPVKYRWVCLPMFPKSTSAEMTSLTHWQLSTSSDMSLQCTVADRGSKDTVIIRLD